MIMITFISDNIMEGSDSDGGDVHTRYIPGAATPDSVVKADEAIRLSELSVRKEADRCKSCSVETLLECNNGGAVDVLLLERIPPVDDTF